jgi:hypothetical protein
LQSGYSALRWFAGAVAASGSLAARKWRRKIEKGETIMKYHARLLATGSAMLVLVWLVLASARTSTAADEKAAAPLIRKIADAFAKGDLEGAKKQSAEFPKDTDLEEVMHLFQLRKNKGEGIGAKPGPNPQTDGIEARLQGLSKRVTANDLKAESEALQRAAFITAAIAEIAIHKCPVAKKTGEKDPKQWKTWCEEMRQSALDLAKTVKEGEPAAVKKAAYKLQNTCLNCHGIFKDNN